MYVALRHLIFVALSLAVFAGGAGGVVARQMRVADADPHDGVARAHTMPVQGIDVSNWQGDIDWAQGRAPPARNSPSSRRPKAATISTRNSLETGMAAKRAGIPRGAYHLFYWCRAAQEQALWFMLNVPNDPRRAAAGARPRMERPFADLPATDRRAKLALEKIKIMLEVMESPYRQAADHLHRRRPSTARCWRASSPGYNFWLRSVAAEPHEIYRNRPWLFWQFTTTGYVSGIDKPVDRNVFNGTPADWRQVLPQRAPKSARTD